MACYIASEFNYLKNFSHRSYVFFELNSKGKQTVFRKVDSEYWTTPQYNILIKTEL